MSKQALLNALQQKLWILGCSVELIMAFQHDEIDDRALSEIMTDDTVSNINYLKNLNLADSDIRVLESWYQLWKM